MSDKDKVFDLLGRVPANIFEKYFDTLVVQEIVDRLSDVSDEKFAEWSGKISEIGLDESEGGVWGAEPPAEGEEPSLLQKASADAEALIEDIASNVAEKPTDE